jgi:hypothetical protein
MIRVWRRSPGPPRFMPDTHEQRGERARVSTGFGMAQSCPTLVWHACGVPNPGGPGGGVAITPKTKSATLSDRAESLEKDGGAERDRTDDLLSAIQALSQLSYSPTRGECSLLTAGGRTPFHRSERRSIRTASAARKCCDDRRLRAPTVTAGPRSGIMRACVSRT